MSYYAHSEVRCVREDRRALSLPLGRQWGGVIMLCSVASLLSLSLVRGSAAWHSFAMLNQTWHMRIYAPVGGSTGNKSGNA